MSEKFSPNPSAESLQVQEMAYLVRYAFMSVGRSSFKSDKKFDPDIIIWRGLKVKFNRKFHRNIGMHLSTSAKASAGNLVY